MEARECAFPLREVMGIPTFNWNPNESIEQIIPLRSRAKVIPVGSRKGGDGRHRSERGREKRGGREDGKERVSVLSCGRRRTMPARADGEESLSDFLGEMDELDYSVYLGSELIVTDTRTVDGPGVF
jgi:hypothetical protein